MENYCDRECCREAMYELAKFNRLKAEKAGQDRIIENEKYMTYINNTYDFHKACNDNNVELAEHFLKNGVFVDETIDKEKWTALHQACRKGNLEIVELLLKYGADINAQTKYSGNPLTMAMTMTRCNLDIVKLLLKNNVVVNFKDRQNQFPIKQELKYCQNPEIVSLIEKAIS